MKNLMNEAQRLKRIKKLPTKVSNIIIHKYQVKESAK